jgi:hypothetical protein
MGLSQSILRLSLKMVPSYHSPADGIARCTTNRQARARREEDPARPFPWEAPRSAAQ